MQVAEELMSEERRNIEGGREPLTTIKFLDVGMSAVGGLTVGLLATAFVLSIGSLLIRGKAASNE